jgi:hypothetical protein
MFFQAREIVLDLMNGECLQVSNVGESSVFLLIDGNDKILCVMCLKVKRMVDTIGGVDARMLQECK